MYPNAGHPCKARGNPPGTTLKSALHDAQWQAPVARTQKDGVRAFDRRHSKARSAHLHDASISARHKDFQLRVVSRLLRVSSIPHLLPCRSRVPSGALLDLPGVQCELETEISGNPGRSGGPTELRRSDSDMPLRVVPSIDIIHRMRIDVPPRSLHPNHW